MKKEIILKTLTALTVTGIVVLTGCGVADTMPTQSTRPIVDETEDGAQTPLEEGTEYTANPIREGTTVTQAGPYGSVTVTIPEGWEYRACPAGDEHLVWGDYGIQFYPGGVKEGCVELAYHHAFGVCGTGLEEVQQTVAGDSANMGYYDGSSIWTFVACCGKNEKIVAVTDKVESWWNKTPQADTGVKAERGKTLTYGEQVMEILDTMKYDAEEQSGAIGVFDEESSIDEIGVKVSARDITRTGATIDFLRYDPEVADEVTTGEYFVVEKKLDNAWKAVDVILDGDYGFHDIAYLISPDEVMSHRYDWEVLYGELDPGDYRMGVKLYGNHKEYTAYAHFIIR